MKNYLSLHKKIYLDMMNKKSSLKFQKVAIQIYIWILELLGALEASKMDYNVFL